MKSDEMDAVFQALASEARRRILDIVKLEPGCNVNRVCEHFDIGRIGVMKHLTVLENAQLLVTEKVGRERLLWFNPVPVHLIYDRWTTEFSAYWAGQLARAKSASRRPRFPYGKKEERNMAEAPGATRAVFRITIKGAIEKIFEELTRTDGLHVPCSTPGLPCPARD